MAGRGTHRFVAYAVVKRNPVSSVAVRITKELFRGKDVDPETRKGKVILASDSELYLRSTKICPTCNGAREYREAISEGSGGSYDCRDCGGSGVKE